MSFDGTEAKNQQHGRFSNSTKTATLKGRLSSSSKQFKRPRTSGNTDPSIIPTSESTKSTTALEIHSNSVQFATRSLSARSLTGTRTIRGKFDSSGRSSGSVTNSSRTVNSIISKKNRGIESEPKVVDHLNSVDNDRLNGSVSPDVHKLLQDISGVLHSMSPVLEPSHSQNSPPEPSMQSTENKRSATSKKPHTRSRVAANFNFNNKSEESRNNALVLSNTGENNPLHPSDNITNKSKSASEEKQKVPHLNIDGSDKKGVAAVKIQRWYRNRHVRDNSVVTDNSAKGGKNHGLGQETLGDRERQVRDVKKLLQEKKNELNRSRLEDSGEVETRDRGQLERERRRAEKLKADRKAAIEELQKRREEKRVRQERVAQEEISLLQASGKIKKLRVSSQTSAKKPAKEKAVENNKGEEKEKLVTVPKPISKEKEKDVVDDFFEAGSIKPSPAIPLPPPVLPNTTSTYNEIMDTLRLLEEIPPPLDPTKETDGRMKLRDSGGLTEGKLQSILSYLDQVEKAEVDRSNELAKSHSRSQKTGVVRSKKTVSLSATGTQHEQVNEQFELDTAAAMANDVTATILAQRMELDSKSKTIEMLQKALKQQRELTVYHTKEMEKEGEKRISLQKSEYEATIKRHQCFIDQLIDDKKVLGERCEQLVKELKELDKKYKSKLSTLEQNHTAELHKLKQVSAAADKLRREKWRTEETQKIKEATVKGLEPEIQKIIAKGKADIQKLKALHEAELLQSDERASKKFVAQMEELREQCALEKEQACTHERELARQRYEKLAEQEELNYQQQRRRLFGEIAQEKEKLAEQSLRQKATLDLKLKENAELHDRLIEELKTNHRQQLEEIQLRHRSEVRNIEDRLEAERQAWEENHIRKQETEMMTKEREMRTQLREERDKEIEMVISRLEEETASSKEENERAAEARIRRIREKYEAELREVERSERSTLEKFNSMKSQVAELEGESSRLQSLLRQRDNEIERIGEVASKLSSERDNVSNVVRQEFADRLVSTEEENKQLKIEMSELRARHKVELERVKQAKNKELEEVHERVKKALEKKEVNLSALKEEYEGALKRADHLQMLLQRQRTELLKK